MSQPSYNEKGSPKPWLVVPLDTSRSAESVLPWAALLARDHGMEVHLVTVWNEDSPLPGFDDRGGSSREVMAAIEKYLATEAVRDAFRGAPVSYEVRTGEVIEQLREVCATRPNSMLMLASHGHGGFREGRLGSITDRALKELHVPVVVIPAVEFPGEE